MNIRLQSGILALAISGSLASAQGTFFWNFNQTSFVVDPGAIILISGTVRNASDSVQESEVVGGTFPLGELENIYTFVPWSEYPVGIYLLPHSSISLFLFGTLIPINLDAPLGTYSSGSASLTFKDAEPQYADPIQVVVVPEPGSGLLGMLGLACLVAKKLLKHRRLERQIP
jgi:hypothetical protein